MLYDNAPSLKIQGYHKNFKVISGVFDLCSSKGIPLPTIFDYFQKNDLLIDWYDFIENCLKNNWNPHTIISKIIECYNKQEHSIIEEKVKLCILEILNARKCEL